MKKNLLTSANINKGDFYNMKKVTVLGCAFLVLMCGCSKKNEVIAKIGDDKITVKMLEERMQEAPASYAGFLSTDAGKKQFLDLLVRERVVVEAAKKEGIKKSKEYVSALNDFKKDQLKRLRDFQESLLMELFIKKLNTKTISASADEVDKYYAENKQDFSRPVEITARHILVDTTDQAKVLLERIKKGEDFSKLAMEYSKDTISAQKGGVIGPFRKGDLVPEFEKAVFALKINQISDIVKTQFGYHIIQKISEKTLPAIPETDAKGYIQNILQKTKFDQWLSDAKKKYGLEVFYNRLKDVTLAAPQGPSEMAEAGSVNLPAKSKKK